MTADDSKFSALEKKIIRQVEFYFGDYNLHRDKFMKDHIAATGDGWFSMDTMMKFQRLSSLCSEPGTILAALKKSSNNLLDVDIENQQIRRKPNRPIPLNDENYRKNLNKRTIYIKGFPQTETIEDITDFLEEYGCVDGVFLRKFKNPHTGSIFKGSLFATFSKLEDATKFLEAPMVYYKDKELEKKTKDEFWKEKEKEQSEKSKPKQSKATQKKKEENDDSAEEFGFVHVSNLEDQTINHLDMKQFLSDLGANECKFFSRFEKNGPTGYILFPDKESVNHMFSLLKNISEDDTGLIKATKIKFDIPTEEQEKEALECYQEFRSIRKDGKKKDFRKKGKPAKRQNTSNHNNKAKQPKYE